MQTLLFLAVIPSVFLAIRVLSYDHIESEPPRLLFKLFVLGMLSCIPAAIIEGMADIPLLRISTSYLMYSLLTYLFVVPLAEEAVKYLVLRTTRRDPNFNYTFDGIVYAVMVGLGFATLENILYVVESQSFSTAIMRALFSVPMHCTCAVFMGYFYGVARGQEVRGSMAEANKAKIASFVVSWILHGLYDFSLDVASAPSLLLTLAFSLLVFWVAARQVKIASANDAPIMVSLSELTTPLPEPEADGEQAPSWSNKGTPPPPFNSDKNR